MTIAPMPWTGPRPYRAEGTFASIGVECASSLPAAGRVGAVAAS
jgi:hypothetical protein